MKLSFIRTQYSYVLRWKHFVVEVFSKLPLIVNRFTRIIVKEPESADKYQHVHLALDDAFSVTLNCLLCL